jgi:hypothetical protein
MSILDPVRPKGSAQQRVGAGRRTVGDLIVSRELFLSLVAAGVVLRLVEYGADRSLWFDESGLALNVVQRSFGELLKPLSFGQAAPPGFLIVERTAADLFGYSEYALRLFPLVSGIAAVVAFAALARRLLTPPPAALALALFAVSSGLVYYSSELKPYEVDVLATVLLLLAGVTLMERPVSGAAAIAIGLGGAALVAFSFASVFVLFAVGAVLAGSALRRGKPPRSLTVVVGIWVLSTAAIALYALARLSDIRDSFKAASGAFLGAHSVLTLHGVNVFASSVAAALGFPQESPWSQTQKVAALAAVVGAGSLIVRSRGRGLMVVLPLGLVFAAAALGQYPLTLRTTLFLAPGVALALAEGVARLVEWAPKRTAPFVAVGLVALIAAGPTWEAARAVVNPRTHEEIKPVLEYVRDHWRRGDTLYIHYGAQYAFLYYEECGCISLTGPRGGTLWPVQPARIGTSLYEPPLRPKSSAVLAGPYGGISRSEQLADLNRLRGRTRVWFLYSHTSNETKSIQPLLRRLSEMGRRVAGIDEPGAHAYLFRLEPSRSR